MLPSIGSCWRPRIFLSYSRAHKETARNLNISLQNSGFRVFFDSSSIASGDFHKVIRQEIHRSDIFIFLASKESMSSESYAQAELAFAEKKWKSPGKSVIPVLHHLP